MRGKDTKRTFFMYLSYECSALEEYLEKMAEKGWLLKSTRGGFFKFRKIGIRKIKYSVDVLDRVSVFDHKDSDVALEYRKYCEAAGWNYICEDGNVQIFYTEGDKDIISIHTDEEEKFKGIFKYSIKVIIGQILLIILFVFSMYEQLTNNAELLLATNIGIFLLTLMFSVILMNCIGIISFYIWVIKAKGRVKSNKQMPYNSYKHLKIKNILIRGYYLILIFTFVTAFVFDIPGSSKFNIPMVLIMLIPLIILIWAKKFTDKNRYSKDSNILIFISGLLVSLAVCIILSYIFVFKINTNIKPSEVPTEKASLTIMDFGYKKNEEKNSYIEFDKSILAQRIKYSYKSGDNYLDYTIFESKYPLLIKLQENSQVSKYKHINFKHEKTNLPGNIRVYVGGEIKNFFVLVSEDKVIFIVKGVSGISEDEFLNMTYKKLF
ncbi:MAG: DUF2812 domain-containing protein [Clostridium sp.]